MFNVKDFWYKTFSKTIEDVEENDKEESITDAIVVLANVEKEDEENPNRIIRRTVGIITWLARKNDRNKIILHSFAHLSESKSSVGFAHKLFKAISEKLMKKGFNISTTPFGYFLEFRMHVLGESLAKVWKTIS
jgi:hypothetical protein